MLVSFSADFAPPIQEETKGFTLRLEPKRIPKVGETLFMYSGQYKGKRTLISDKFKILGVENVRLKIFPNYGFGSAYRINIWINELLLPSQSVNQFCVMDGFKDDFDFVKYWTRNFKKKEIDVTLKMIRWVKLPFKH